MANAISSRTREFRKFVDEVCDGKQLAAAKRLDVPPNTVWRWYHDKMRFSVDMALKIERISNGVVRKEKLIWDE